jgi:hypothetical protein
MPVSLLIRWIVRLAVGLLVWRTATARRAARAPAGGPPVAGEKPRTRIDARAAATAIREAASLGWRAISFAVFLVAAVVLVTAGTTSTVLSPRWLGGVLLGLAVLALVGAALEARMVVRLLRARRRRHHDDDLRHLIS